MQREQVIKNWLDMVLNAPYQLNYLLGDASFRRYARVHCANQTYMLMDAPPDKEDCVPFVQIDEFFDQNGVRVPHIIAKNLEQGLLLLEDFGDVVLAQLLDNNTVDGYYLQSFKQIIHLQSIDATGILPPYSREKLLQEMQLLTDWLLPSLQIELNDDETKIIAKTFGTLADCALNQPQVIVHRDFHSRNLMKIADETDLGVIDFQDAVIGADTYDLISITRDAYVQWLPNRVEQWFKQFYDLLPEQAKQNRSFSDFKRDADLMAMQRHIKILGIFVRLFERDGKAGYLKDLPRVMWYVCHIGQQYAELADFMQLLEQKILPPFNEKYGTYQVIT
ncbi:aminoglycoside phosphotransferase family protein [Moraxella sp. ZY210820]|uniref:aminoglycoside phosphotransferase family protein n=1 Tax=unclassified Moraxella TaxID=2685852 RepID=UPI00273148BC|nr:phosphotransferase [Moraxella sp. ZY210820]WLF84871.1 phosphotransferase [Moraxella sp. ZY210820]